MAPKCDAMLVGFGRAEFVEFTPVFVEVGSRAGARNAQLVQRATDIDWPAALKASQHRHHARVNPPPPLPPSS